MASQDQNIDHSTIQNSSVQQEQAGRDAVSFLNSDDNRVIINNITQRLFGKSEPIEIDWDWGKRVLKEKQLPEIRQRLTDTLGRNRIFMDVAIAEQPSWVNRSLLEADRRLQIDGKDCGILDPNTMLIETFGRDDIEGKLLILGAPGSGKTTALLSLAEQLVCGALAQPKTVIPVLFELSTWRDDNQSIHDWLIEQLYDLHGGNRKRKIYEKWLERQILLPLLDGLDELGLERQKKCTDKLNEFAKKYSQMVVCCRVKEFETVNMKLSNLRGAVCLQPLSDGQIEAYLHSIHRSELWSAMQTNPNLQALLKTTPEGDPGLLRVPLFVKLTADVYDPNEPIGSKKDLLEKYIERQLSFDQRERDRRKELERREWAYKTVEAEPKLQETISSLSWIARQLQANKTVDLLIEQMQPSWIETKHLQKDSEAISENSETISENSGAISEKPGWISKFISWVERVVRFLINLVVWFFLYYVGFWKWLINHLLTINHLLIFYLLIFLLLALPSDANKIKPVEVFQLLMSSTTRRKILKAFGLGLTYGLIYGLIFGLIFGLILELVHWLIFGLIFGVIIGLICGLICGLIYGLTVLVLEDQELKDQLRPNQGIWNSLQSVLWATTFSYLLAVGTITIALFTFSVMEGISKNHNWMNQLILIFFQSLKVGVFVILIVGPFFGGIACIQHLFLRLILWRSGTIPWNFARFLNYCVERRLLLRIGGRYRFLHRELLDHFAQSGS
jgi:DNA polymerase III delta prime subunit